MDALLRCRTDRGLLEFVKSSIADNLDQGSAGRLQHIDGNSARAKSNVNTKPLRVIKSLAYTSIDLIEQGWSERSDDGEKQHGGCDTGGFDVESLRLTLQCAKAHRKTW